MVRTERVCLFSKAGSCVYVCVCVCVCVCCVFVHRQRQNAVNATMGAKVLNVEEVERKKTKKKNGNKSVGVEEEEGDRSSKRQKNRRNKIKINCVRLISFIRGTVRAGPIFYTGAGRSDLVGFSNRIKLGR